MYHVFRGSLHTNISPLALKVAYNFSKAAHSAGQHIPESMLLSPKKVLILFPSSFNTWSQRRGTASGNTGAS